ncbi:Bug family tripartite tricarboxylate transporter substrate binding protein [Cupriavidus oxalaticus]
MSVLIMLVCSTAPSFAGAAWPDRPIHLIVPFPPGGPTDSAARVYSDALGRELGQPVIVENKPGVSGAIAAVQVKNVAPDGYTLMMLVTPTIMAPHLFKNVKFDPVNDFDPITKIYDLPNLIAINPKVLPGVSNLKSLFDLSKSKDGGFPYTSSGVGSSGNLSMELMKYRKLHNMSHIAYKGSAPAMNDTLGGVVPVIYADLVSALPQIRAGRLKALAVGTPQRVKALPNVPTIAEQGFSGFEASSWGGLVAPRNTPSNIILKISQISQKILASDDLKKRFDNIGIISSYMSPQDTKSLIGSDFTRWGEVIRVSGIVAE